MIDELERVRSFRSEEPLPTDEAQRAARAALTLAMAGRRHTSPHLLRSGEPARDRRRIWLLRGAVAAGAAVAAVVIASLVSSGSPTAPSPAVAAVLRQLANIAAAGPSIVPGPRQYLYVNSQNDGESDAYARHRSCVTHATQHRQIWIGADGSGLLRETSGPATFTSPADRAACLQMIPHNQLSARGPSNLWFAARCVMLGPTNDMQALSTNPRTLLRQMRRIDGGPPGPGEDFVHVGDFLRETDASPAVRAALYRAAALIPGVHLLGTVRDHRGRHGLGVAYGSHGNRSELIFNPGTGALMGEQSITASGAEGYWAVYLQSRIVDRLPHRPPVRLSPPCINGGGYARQTRYGAVITGRPVTSRPNGLLPRPRASR